MPGASAFPPSTSKFRPSAILFVSLNVVRLFSIICILLVFVSQILSIKDDVKAVKDARAAVSEGRNETESLLNYAAECEYIEFSAVPNQTGGVFWTELNRVFLLIACIFLLLSELSLPSKPLARFYEGYIPVLSNKHGLGFMGVLQCWFATNILSKWVEKFEQVSGWLLFSVGCINLLLGIALRAKAKEKRLIFSWENVTSVTPQTRMAYSAYKVYDEKLKPFTLNTKGSSFVPTHHAKHSTDTLVEKEEAKSSSETDYTEPKLNLQAKQPPQSPRSPGWRFGGFGFGKQGQKKAEDRGFVISKPLGTLPKYVGDASYHA